MAKPEDPEKPEAEKSADQTKQDGKEKKKGTETQTDKWLNKWPRGDH